MFDADALSLVPIALSVVIIPLFDLISLSRFSPTASI
jgi:hypothetical protein